MCITDAPASNAALASRARRSDRLAFVHHMHHHRHFQGSKTTAPLSVLDERLGQTIEVLHRFAIGALGVVHAAVEAERDGEVQ